MARTSYARPLSSGLFRMNKQVLVMHFYINSTVPSSACSAEAWPWGRLPRFAASCNIWLIECSIPVHINILSWKKPFCYFSLCLRNTSTSPSHNRAFSNSGFSNSAPGDKEIASWHCWFSTTVLNMVREDAGHTALRQTEKILISCKLFILSPCHFQMWEKLTTAFIWKQVYPLYYQPQRVQLLWKFLISTRCVMVQPVIWIFIQELFLLGSLLWIIPGHMSLPSCSVCTCPGMWIRVRVSVCVCDLPFPPLSFCVIFFLFVQIFASPIPLINLQNPPEQRLYLLFLLFSSSKYLARD